ncbi:MAG: hypothetical protein J2P21_19460 [Chloracidobacterium sp.]|nr:hypothetical protein [Chloracidobacterium sp.]
MTKPKADLLQNALDMFILKPSAWGTPPLWHHPAHALSDEFLEVEQGFALPRLSTGTNRGWISSKWDKTGWPFGQVLHVTKAGKQLKTEEVGCDRLALTMARVR